ncbi:PREDICTED: AP-3 complex subunit delta-1-like [Priapulus caudatus]|uniref:AP-3 complex subunit delta-1-like n=1 Tax=Priapulus caudatus TaxID=37621 RepID=A0ABM1ERY4_PRICU|nr:PREDICTED: AP-3 complex subunit delta-1-like [Priapulus caudatus]
MSSFRLLGENSNVKLTYETRVDATQKHRVIVSVVFTNLTPYHIKQLDFNVLDSLNTKLIRGDQCDGVKVPFQLPAGSSNQGQFAFTVQTINHPQKLRGTLTYFIATEDGSTNHDKLDFKLGLPCSAFTLPTPHDRETFADLLAGGELEYKNSIKLSSVTGDLRLTLTNICFFTHFSVVEAVDSSASLYSRSIQDHHLALLVKTLPNNGVSIDGKSNDPNLLSSVLDEVRTILLQ